MTHRARDGVVVFVAAAVLGVAVFGVLAWRSVTVVQMDARGALSNFEDAKRTRALDARVVPRTRRDLAQLMDVLLLIAQHDALTRITADERADRRRKVQRVEEQKLGRAFSAGW